MNHDSDKDNILDEYVRSSLVRLQLRRQQKTNDQDARVIVSVKRLVVLIVQKVEDARTR